MTLVEESLFLALTAFNVVILIDFLVLELVLKLNVFAQGKTWLRLILIGSLQLEGLLVFALSILTDPQQQKIVIVTTGLLYLLWNPLYFHMIIEQNIYWMSAAFIKTFYIILFIYMVIMVLLIGLFTVVSVGILSSEHYTQVHYIDLCQLIIISIAEIFILFNVFIEARSKVKSVSLELWHKVQFCLLVCTLCIILDFGVVTVENLGYGLLAYLSKTSTFTFKVVFECLCFQFIKGIILSIEQ
jgi:hypothetical protein